VADVKLVFDVLANDKASPVLNHVQKAAGGFGSALGKIGEIASGVVIGGALTQLPGMMLDFAKAAAEDEQSTMRVSQVLKTLPGDYEANTAAVNAAIEAGQRKAFGDDVVRDSFTKLAVATGDSEEAIKRQSIAMDLARGANIPLADASKLLGKVTDDNLQVFKRLGITLPDVTDEAGVLAAVQAKFAGQADAYANSTAGQFEQAQLAFSETQEAIGSALLPALTAVGRVLADNLPKVQSFISTFATGFGDTLADVMDGFSEMFADVMQGDLPGAMTAAKSMIEEFVPEITNALKGWAEAFVAWIGPMIPVFLEELQNLAGQLLQWLGEVIPQLVEGLAAWAAAFIDWVAPQIPDLLRELGHLLENALTWLGDALPPILEKLAQWGLAFVEWIAPRIPPMLLELAKVLLELGGWIITTALPVIILKLAEWGAAFITWIATEVLPKLPGALADIWSALSSWMGTTASNIGSAAAAWGQELVSGFIGGLAGLGGQLQNAVANAVNSINVNAGPFHLSAGGGFRVDAPQIGAIHMPAPPMPDVGFRAAGGPVSAGGAYVVGEQGPEMFVPRSAGTIVPNGAGGGPVINGDIVLKLDRQTIARVTREELLQLGRRNGNAFGTLGVSTP
jgi:hypothetical protein